MRTTLRNLTRIERDQYVALGAWARRRTQVPAGSTPIPYASLAAPVIWIFVVVSAVEVVVVHVLLHPWPVPRWIAFALGAWGLIWMVGFLAAYRTRPHSVDADELRVRAGAAAEVRVPAGLVGQVVVKERDLPSSSRLTSLETDDDGTWCGVGVSGRTNVQVGLREPLVIAHPGLTGTGDVEITSLGLWADDPREARRRIVELLPRT